MTSLDHAGLKVARAEEHLAALAVEVKTYIDLKPYALVIEKESSANSQHTTWWGRAVVSVEPPVRLSLLVGDCVTNTRAALDYIAWQLAARYFTTPALRLAGDMGVSF